MNESVRKIFVVDSKDLSTEIKKYKQELELRKGIFLF